MNKVSIKQKGFTSIELLLVVLLLVILGFVGYYVYHTRHNNQTTNVTKTSTATQYPEYNIKTTVPSSWSTYSNSSYSFSISHPSNWTPTLTSQAQPAFSADASIKTFNVEFNDPSSAENVNIDVVNLSLKQALALLETTLLALNKDNSFPESSKIVDTKYYTFKGYNAVQLDSTVTTKATGSTIYNLDFVVYAKGNSYDFSSQGNPSSNVINNNNVATALGSLTIK